MMTQSSHFIPRVRKMLYWCKNMGENKRNGSVCSMLEEISLAFPMISEYVKCIIIRDNHASRCVLKVLHIYVHDEKTNLKALEDSVRHT